MGPFGLHTGWHYQFSCNDGFPSSSRARLSVYNVSGITKGASFTLTAVSRTAVCGVGRGNTILHRYQWSALNCNCIIRSADFGHSAV
mmetsp:Transcript_22013/g.31132  ORF Transcript_22013/g.31132 Transcript_22013/m.31132 type:complete len:87 (+) Transcript_22013:297-557(+)